MSAHIEWARATGQPYLIDEDDAQSFSDGHGTQLDDGNVGLMVGDGEDGAVLEGSREEIAAWLRRALVLVEAKR